MGLLLVITLAARRISRFRTRRLARRTITLRGAELCRSTPAGPLTPPAGVFSPLPVPVPIPVRRT
jgi:hypothetical protein